MNLLSVHFDYLYLITEGDERDGGAHSWFIWIYFIHACVTILNIITNTFCQIASVEIIICYTAPQFK